MKSIMLTVLVVTGLLITSIAAGTSQAPTNEDSALEKVSVRWKGRSYRGTELPEAMGMGPVSAVEAWAAWALEHGYQLNLTSDLRVLMISPRRNSKLSRQLELIGETQRLFDKLLPAPEREEVVGLPERKGQEPEPEEPADGELPEDPEGGPVGWLPDDEEPLEYTFTYEWGAGTWPVDTETCVLFVVKNEKDYGSLVDQLGEMQDYLKSWAETGKQFTGFVHERPLVSAYIEDALGQQEWDPDNEVVHRVAQMLFVRRFSSQQPYWLTQGLSWYIENKIRKGIYCFPYRNEFVFATEHTSWDNELTNRFKDRKNDPIRPEEFATWMRGKYEGDVARLSYGLVGFIARYHDENFSEFLEALRLHALEENRIELGDGTWERDPNYKLSAKDQAQLIEKFFGGGFLEDAGEFFREGPSFRPRKP